MRFVRGALFTTVVVCAMLAASASAASAADYTANVTPNTVAPGSSTTFTVVLASESQANPLNAARITPPQGFTITAASLVNSSGNATVTMQGRQAVLKGISLQNNQSASVLLTATAPSSCENSSWTVQAFKSSLNGPQLSLDSAHSSLTTTCLVPVDTQPCPEGSSCTVTVTSATATFSVTAGPSTSAGTLTAQVDPGSRLVCPGYTGIDSNWYGFSESTTTRSKTVNYTVFDTSSSTAGVEVCFGAPYEFETLGDANAPPATMPDGSPGFLGLLERCDGDVDPCVQSITTVADPNVATKFDTVITAIIPAGEPGDPWMHG